MGGLQHYHGVNNSEKKDQRAENSASRITSKASHMRKPSITRKTMPVITTAAIKTSINRITGRTRKIITV